MTSLTFLKTRLGQENAYQPSDYLRQRQQQDRSPRSEGGFVHSMVFALPFKSQEAREMSTQSQWQIGQWYGERCCFVLA